MSLRLLYVLYAAYRAYRALDRQDYSGTSYVGITLRGVPHTAVFLGVGREAWRISLKAMEEKL